MRIRPNLTGVILFFTFFPLTFNGQAGLRDFAENKRYLTAFIDSLRIFDTHEHLFNPDQIKRTNFNDFSLLFQQYSYDDLVSAGFPDSLFNSFFNSSLKPKEKWKLIEPYWQQSFNTAANRVLLAGIKGLYDINDLNISTVEPLSEKISSRYDIKWFNHVISDLCKIDHIVQDGNDLGIKNEIIRYAERFTPWITVNSKFRIDSLAVIQIEPIYTLEDFVKSMRNAFEECLKKGMVAVKINIAYKRTLFFEKVSPEIARKVFRTIVNGNEDLVLFPKDVKPLQDYMVYQLLDLANKYRMPVLFHTGLQAGTGNILDNSDPLHLANLFHEYPKINFALFHGSYPFGGELSALAKTFRNVYVDMNWTFAISPSYAERYLAEWLETVPVGKIMYFGADQRCVENIYGELIIAKELMSKVLAEKVSAGQMTLNEAKITARLLFHDNAERFYNLQHD